MAEPIKTRRNLYQGINPHLQSKLQTPGNDVMGASMWPSFHKDHITDISNFLNNQLPEPYVARSEHSLQIRIEDTEGLLPPKVHRPEPDVTIYRQSSGSVEVDFAIAPETIAEIWVGGLEETLDLTEDFVPAVIIRDLRQHGEFGQPVTRIEVLSPSNKPGSRGYELYRKNRNDALYDHIPLIELDYLHEYPPPIMKYPVYPRQHNSHPYHIFISDPRPALSQGRIAAHRFDIDSAFPLADIPLTETEKLTFDFGAVYKFTYRSGRWGNHVDYTQLPIRFDTYSPADQARIERRMALIAEAHARGDDLEQD